MEQYKNKYGAIEDENLKCIRNKSISASLKGKHKTPQHVANMRKSWIENGNRSKLSIRMRENNPMKDNKAVQKMRKTSILRGVFKRSGERMEKMWKEPQYRNMFVTEKIKNNPMKRKDVMIKNIMAHNREKSGIELIFESLIDSETKPKLEYTGNNKLWINYKNPDYLIKNTDNVIEITSSYRGRTFETYDKNRIEHFKNAGYNCLCIWIDYIPKRLFEDVKKQINIKIKEFIQTGISQSWRYQHNEV
jgi:vacuolar-type H+-ATPase subunit E/Vma4